MTRLLMNTAAGILAIALFVSPVYALDIGGGGSHGGSSKDGGSGGVSASVDRGGVSVNAGKTKASVGVGGKGGGVEAHVSAPGGAEAEVNVLSSKGVLDADVRSRLLTSIDAKLYVLSHKNLLKLCLNIGGGGACKRGSKSDLIGLIQARLEALSPKTLASLCVSVGGTGCGGGGNGSSGGPRNVGGIDLSDLSDSDIEALQTRCVDVVRKPNRYDAQLIKLCRILAEL